VERIVLSLLDHSVKLSQLLVLLVSAQRQAAEGRANAKESCMISHGRALQIFDLFGQQVLVVLGCDSVCLQQTIVRHGAVGDAWHHEHVILAAGVLCEVCIICSLCARLQVARLLSVFVLLFGLFYFLVVLHADFSKILALWNFDVAEACLLLHFSVVDEVVIRFTRFLFLFLIVLCTEQNGQSALCCRQLRRKYQNAAGRVLPRLRVWMMLGVARHQLCRLRSRLRCEFG
jgi:hypothetical protein